MTKVRLAGVSLLLSIGCWTACREVSVCDTNLDCTPHPSTAGAGGELAPTRTDGGASGLGEAGNFEAGAGGANASAGGAAGEPAGGQPPVGPSCASGYDECDESTLTVCETPTSFSFRHCGACNVRCNGACSVGKCKPAQSLLDEGVLSFAANKSAAFALVSAPNDTENLLRFDTDSGKSRVVTEGLAEGAHLLLGSDRLYASYSHRVVSLPLDGVGVLTEAFLPETFGVTNAGAYYTSYLSNPKTHLDTWTLWFRPQGSSAFTAISVGNRCDILGSAAQALLVRCETTSNAEILLARGAELTRLGDSPGEPIVALPAANGAVFLMSNEAAPSGYELVWLVPDEPPAHVALETRLADFHLVPAPNSVGLHLEARNNTFVRLYDPDGSSALPLGIPNFSTVAYVDERYIWYSWFGASDASQQFLRARQFELKDLLPTE